MLGVYLTDSVLQKYAAKTEHTADDLADLAEKIEQAVQSRFLDHFESARLRGGANYWLLDGPGNGAWLAFNSYGIVDELNRADAEYGAELLTPVCVAYLQEFQSWGATVAIPGPLTRSNKDPYFLPIYVPYPDDWDVAQSYTYFRFRELVSQYEMSPAEALDYWAVTSTNNAAREWAGIRNVEPESVRKNVRQAKEKLGDDDLGGYPEEGIKAVDFKDVPEEPHDEDMLYVPKADEFWGEMTEADGK